MRPDWQSPDGSISLYRGDCLDILPTIDAAADAIVTDPPYSSGGAFRGDRAQNALTKYVRTELQDNYSTFTGDSRDQRSFFAWSTLWLCALQQLCRDGAVICCFTDWRQLPVMSDALQAGGWVWRNIATWWKPGCRMQKGRFSSSAEYVLYGTNGPHEPDGEKAAQNVLSCAPVPTDDKVHIAEKPVDVLKWCLQVTTPGGLVVDPFVGSGTTAIACIQTGRRFIGIEKSKDCFAAAVAKIEAEIQRTPLFGSAAIQGSLI